MSDAEIPAPVPAAAKLAPAPLTHYYIFDNATGDIVQSGKDYDTPELRSRASAGQTFAVADPLATVIPKAGVHKIDPATFVVAALEPVARLPIAGKVSSLTESCKTAITGGFRSGALSATAPPQMYFYPSTVTDQLNLLHGGNIVCRDASGIWASRPHTDAQIVIVRAAFNSLRDTARTKLAVLSAQARAATTEAQLDAIAWGNKV